jgi:hypothetical protein
MVVTAAIPGIPLGCFEMHRIMFFGRFHMDVGPHAFWGLVTVIISREYGI